MLQVKSNLHTKMAYDGGAEAKDRSKSMSRKVERVELAPGINNLTDEQAEILGMDPFFRKHVRRGHFSIIEPEPEPKPAPVADKTKEAPPKDDMAEFVASFLALEPSARKAMLPTLTPEQVAAVKKAAKPNV